MKPSCFDSEEQYVLWIKAADFNGTGAVKKVCVDCTPSYAAQMRKIGRCEFPENKFKFDEEEGVFVGYSQEEEPKLGPGRPRLTEAQKNKKVKKEPSFVGVSWNVARQKWQARIWYGNKCRSLGYFEVEEDASKEYERAVKAKMAKKKIVFTNAVINPGNSRVPNAALAEETA